MECGRHHCAGDGTCSARGGGQRPSWPRKPRDLMPFLKDLIEPVTSLWKRGSMAMGMNPDNERMCWRDWHWLTNWY
ncbi:hypothetical protein Y1Q_0004353 [Alligator mississippiensis]|uniref:Uncharacterized protein n=1 Tax=Alligator mississippiensis TaxID=8496 RepID=A0A151MIG8_ALLMI|nr:hypothetical protein Y1Q_0004353 [Alligator mississippiensis]